MQLMIADGQRLTLNGILSALDGVDGIEVVGAVTTASELLLELKRVQVDVVLMDSELADMESLKCLGIVRQNYPDVKVGMLFGDRDQGRIHTALGAGAAACVMKRVDPADLPAAIRQVVEATVFTAGFSGAQSVELEPQAIGDLTQREVTMLKAIARGLSNKAISQELWVSQQTVKFHLNNVYRKLGVPNRTAAARLAYEHGLVDHTAVVA